MLTCIIPAAGLAVLLCTPHTAISDLLRGLLGGGLLGRGLLAAAQHAAQGRLGKAGCLGAGVLAGHAQLGGVLQGGRAMRASGPGYWLDPPIHQVAMGD
jgi:hypothetical protein